MDKKKKGFFWKIILMLLLVGIGIGGVLGNYWYKNFKVINVKFKQNSINLFIPIASTQNSVMKQINSLYIVKDIESLRWLAEQKNYKGDLIVPGEYKIESGWTNNQLINHLRSGNGRLDAKISFTNVKTLKDLSFEMSKGILLEQPEIYDWLMNEDSIAIYGFKKETIVSMFIPNTYRVDFDIKVPELMARMNKEYKIFWNPNRKLKLKEIALAQSEVTTLASIVFAETNSTKDMTTIAGVYMNRIKFDWPLQADPTVIFANNDFSIRRVLDKHTKFNSPYNTYMHTGLPPGPINIPPTRYIDAVLNYEKHDYFFFVAKEDFSGDSYFAKNLAQHTIYARRWQKALNNQRIYK